jgi:short-subunit dehydrogenase
MSSAQNSAYCATKSAVRAYSDSLRPELAPFNVHVVHVAPGVWWRQRQAGSAVRSSCSHRQLWG